MRYTFLTLFACFVLEAANLPSPPKQRKEVRTKGAFVPFVSFKNPYNIGTELPAWARTNLVWDAVTNTEDGGPLELPVEYEVIQTVDWTNWTVLGVTTNTKFYLGPLQTNLPIRLFRVGVRYVQ